MFVSSRSNACDQSLALSGSRSGRPPPEINGRCDGVLGDAGCAARCGKLGVWRRSVEAGRQLAADFINAVPEEIAFVRNTTEGVALVAQGWNWSPGESVVVPDSEFPSNLYPWMALEARGVQVRVVPGCGMLNGDDLCRRLLEAVDGTTRIVAVSWVDYSTGRRRPLSQLADPCSPSRCIFVRRCHSGARCFTAQRSGNPHRLFRGPTATNGCSVPKVPESCLSASHC